MSSPNYRKNVFDILLRAIEIADTPGNLCMAEQDALCTLEANALVDGMASVTATRPTLQRRPDVVSGSCAIFGMKIATQKIRTFQVNLVRRIEH